MISSNQCIAVPIWSVKTEEWLFLIYVVFETQILNISYYFKYSFE